MQHVSKDALNFLVALVYTKNFRVFVYTDLGLLKFKITWLNRNNYSLLLAH